VKNRIIYLIVVLGTLFSIFTVLTGCVSSHVSRDVASNTDRGFHNARALFYSAGQDNIADTYQNTSQAVKGAVLGGAAGAIVGATSSGVGIFPGTAIGTIFGASYGSYLDANTSLQDQLINRGAIVMVLGDRIKIIWPAARLFYADSACIKSSAYSTLYLLTNYINHYTSMLVKVTSYTDRMPNFKESLALSQRQADAIVKFLWGAGLNTRVLSAVGAGAVSFVEKPNESGGESENNRIEITLKKLAR
jgi:outer membrane protein OmpA-like peptidoglycan-associated protein